MTSKPYIFLVEDDLSFGAVLKSYLEIHDFEVDWVDDGQHALGRFHQAAIYILPGPILPDSYSTHTMV